MSFRIVDLPEPLAPRITFVCPGSSVKLTSFNTTLSSKASDTLSTTTTGWSCVSGLANVAVPEVSYAHPTYSNVISNLRHEEVHRDHCNRRGHDGVGRGPTDALGTALGAKSHMTANGHDDISKAERLDNPHPRIVEVQPVDDRGPVDARRDPQLEDRDEPSPDDPDRARDHSQDRRHEETRKHTRDDQLSNRDRSRARAAR